jgi:predicted N-formylglutamate amidohydrolase
MSTITTEALLAARIDELHHRTWNDSREICQQIQDDAPGKTWVLLDDHTYATIYDGKAGPAVLSIFHDEEPSLVFGDHAEAVLEGYEVSVEALSEVVG